MSDGIENPFIMLRLGESLYELGEVNKSKSICLGHILEGYSIFIVKMINILKLKDEIWEVDVMAYVTGEKGVLYTRING